MPKFRLHVNEVITTQHIVEVEADNEERAFDEVWHRLEAKNRGTEFQLECIDAQELPS